MIKNIRNLRKEKHLKPIKKNGKKKRKKGHLVEKVDVWRGAVSGVSGIETGFEGFGHRTW